LNEHSVEYIDRQQPAGGCQRQRRIICDMQMELFHRQKGGWFRIVSGSMRPLLNVGDRIFAEHVTADRIAPRDIILFKSEGAFVTHRVMRVVNENGTIMLLQKGDAGGVAATVPGKSVIGIVTSVEKKGRPLSIQTGRLGAVNQVLGLTNTFSYRIKEIITTLKQNMRNKPGYPYLRQFYRGLKRPFGFLGRSAMKVLIG
jgi:signal peptidase I